jgi:hypothetical protein
MYLTILRVATKLKGPLKQFFQKFIKKSQHLEPPWLVVCLLGATSFASRKLLLC